MRKCLIVCWYGLMPSYYKLWQCSCNNNKDYDFLIFTDQNITSEMDNLKIINMSFNELKDLIEKKLSIKVNFSKPYKLCDFRPAYGVIFEDYIRDYNYWGHCDLDQVFGKISDFIPDNELCNYEKINHNGHFVLYKNETKINNMFRKNGAIYSWKEVFTHKENYAFDEYYGINRIMKENNISQAFFNQFADIDKKYKRYRTINHSNWKKQIFVLDGENICRYVYEDGKIQKKDSFFYLHFQKKIPLIDDNIDYNKKIVMGCNAFSNVDVITEKTFDIFNPSKSSFSEKVELLKYLLRKIGEFIKSNNLEKIIKIKQKGAL